jgi:transcriptional regulator with XRE-family HTH domain
MTDLRAALRAAGVSAPFLARATGKHPSTIDGWLSGRISVPPPVLAWLSRRLADPPPKIADRRHGSGDQ